jgi:hypothetical protein
MLKKNKQCKDCKTLIFSCSIRCKSCARKGRGSKNGASVKKYFCIDCNKQISYRAHRCHSCSAKNCLKIFKHPMKNRQHSKKTKLLMKKMRILYHKKYPNLFMGKNNPNYVDGKSKDPYPLEFNDQLKYKIRERDNFECQNCHMTEEEHLTVYGTVLCVHHIDYDKNNCKEDNLIAFCWKCNILVNYNRDYWTKILSSLIISKKTEINSICY